MEKFEIVYRNSIKKDLRRIPKKDIHKILKKIQSLADNPFPPDVKKLSSQERYRLRQGDYRILYEIKNDQLIITIVKVGHRRDIYQGR